MLRFLFPFSSTSQLLFHDSYRCLCRVVSLWFRPPARVIVFTRLRSGRQNIRGTRSDHTCHLTVLRGRFSSVPRYYVGCFRTSSPVRNATTRRHVPEHFIITTTADSVLQPLQDGFFTDRPSTWRPESPSIYLTALDSCSSRLCTSLRPTLVLLCCTCVK